MQAGKMAEAGYTPYTAKIVMLSAGGATASRPTE